MATEKMAKLVESLLAKSKAGSLDWQKTAAPGVFATSFPQYSITTATYRDEHGEEEYFLQIFNSSGELVEDVMPSEFASLLRDSYMTFREIYELARARAMGVDAAVDEILSFLDKPEVPF